MKECPVLFYVLLQNWISLSINHNKFDYSELQSGRFNFHNLLPFPKKSLGFVFFIKLNGPRYWTGQTDRSNKTVVKMCLTRERSSWKPCNWYCLNNCYGSTCRYLFTPGWKVANVDPVLARDVSFGGGVIVLGGNFPGVCCPQGVNCPRGNFPGSYCPRQVVVLEGNFLGKGAIVPMVMGR